MSKTETHKNQVVRERPLSPHLTIYKPQITSVLSISHRISGVFLLLGTALIVWWLIAIALGPEAYSCFTDVISWSIADIIPIGKLVMLGWTIALFLHFANGIRHLVWDMGFGLTLPQVSRSGWAAILFTVIATIAAWYAAFYK